MTSMRVTLALMLVMVAVLLAAGCAGESDFKKNQSGDLSSLRPVPVTTIPTHTMSADPGSTPGSKTELTIGSTKEVLVYLNGITQWNLTPSQIDEYSVHLENGVLKKYRTNPEFPHALYIPDQWQFHHEMGESLGFTKEEADNFVSAIKEHRKRGWQTGDCRNYSSPDPKEGCPQVKVTMNFSITPRPVVTSP